LASAVRYVKLIWLVFLDLYRVAVKKVSNAGANLVFAPSLQGEHKVRPYKKKYLFDGKSVLMGIG
jgi:hypothetical protein